MQVAKSVPRVHHLWKAEKNIIWNWETDIWDPEASTMQTSVPCTSRKPKSDKLLKSLGVVCKTSPWENLNASGFSEGKPWGCALGFAFGKSHGFRLLPWVKFFQTTPRLFNSLSHFIPMSHVTFGLPSFTLCLSQFCWWFRMTWKLLTGTSLIECLIWLPGIQGDTQCDIWMRDFLLVINFMQSRLQTFSSSSLIHSILHFFLLQDFFAFPAVALFTVFCEHWGVSQITPNQKLALRIVRYDISAYMEAVCEKVTSLSGPTLDLKIDSFVWFLL